MIFESIFLTILMNSNELIKHSSLILAIEKVVVNVTSRDISEGHRTAWKIKYSPNEWEKIFPRLHFCRRMSGWRTQVHLTVLFFTTIFWHGCKSDQRKYFLLYIALRVSFRVFQTLFSYRTLVLAYRWLSITEHLFHSPRVGRINFEKVRPFILFRLSFSQN